MHILIVRDMPEEVAPGQVYMDVQLGGTFVAVVCSREPDYDEGEWMCKVFQEWDFGAYDLMVNFNNKPSLIYLGCLKDLRRIDFE